MIPVGNEVRQRIIQSVVAYRDQCAEDVADGTATYFDEPFGLQLVDELGEIIEKLMDDRYQVVMTGPKPPLAAEKHS